MIYNENNSSESIIKNIINKSKHSSVKLFYTS